MRNPLKTAGYVVLFLVSFIFFVYFTFPYEVLKENVSAELSSATGYSIHIGKLGSKFPIGLEARDVNIDSSGASPLQISKFKVRISLLSLLIGRVSVEVEVVDKGGGTFAAEVTLSAFKLIFSQAALPSRIELESDNFSIGQWIDFALGALSKGSSVNPLLAPILTKLGFIGKLKAKVEFDLDSGDPTQSNGTANIQLKDALLKLSDPAFNLPDQKFSKAGIQAKLAGGTLTLDKGSGFIAQDFSLETDGKVLLKGTLAKSTVDIAIKLSLKKALKEQFGSILDAILGGSRDGEISFKVSGTLSSPNMQTI